MPFHTMSRCSGGGSRFIATVIFLCGAVPFVFMLHAIDRWYSAQRRDEVSHLAAEAALEAYSQNKHSNIYHRVNTPRILTAQDTDIPMVLFKPPTTTPNSTLGFAKPSTTAQKRRGGVTVQSDRAMDRREGCKKLMWFTAVAAAPGTEEIPTAYSTYLMAAMMSALRVAPSLEPHLIYDGPGDPELIRWWRSMGGTVHNHHLSFFRSLEAAAKHHPQGWLDMFATFLRIDIPLILATHKPPPSVHPNYVLYTDGDVLFLKDVDSCSFPETATIRMGPEHERGEIANAGVLYINVQALGQYHAAMVKWGHERRWPDCADQTLLLKFFEGGKHGGLQLLEDRFNWKGYWGRDDEAVILHFHGPKPMICLDCFVLHARDVGHCGRRFPRCRAYQEYWTVVMTDGGKYFTEVLTKFYFYVGLASSPWI